MITIIIIDTVRVYQQLSPSLHYFQLKQPVDDCIVTILAKLDGRSDFSKGFKKFVSLLKSRNGSSEITKPLSGQATFYWIK